MKNILVLVMMVAISGCEGSNSSATTTNAITIDNAGVVPILNNNPTTSIIYVHNNSSNIISAINYTAKLNTKNKASIFLESNSIKKCEQIQPHRSCALKFTTPSLGENEVQGSAIISLNYMLNHERAGFSQMLNFQLVSAPGAGLNFSSGVTLSGFGHSTAYGTVYVYAGGSDDVYTTNNLTSDKNTVSTVNANAVLYAQKTSSNTVQALEISAPVTAKNTAATLQLRSVNQLGQSFISTSYSAIISSGTGGILVAGQVPVIDTAENSSPAGSLLISNNGNATVTLGSSSASNSGITNLSGCTNGTVLMVGESCTITFRVNQIGGSGRITLNYAGGSSTTSINQTVTWFNSQDGALINMNYTSPININPSNSKTDMVTVTNIGGYNLINLTIIAPQTLGAGTATTTISYPDSNSCQNATLNINASCQFILNVTGSSVETNQQIIFGITGSYNNGSSQTYTRYSLLNYSTAPNTYLYAANSDSDTLSAYTVNTATGALIRMSNSPVATGDHPTQLAMTPDNKYLYSVNEYSNTNNVYAYSINQSDGLLTHIGTYTTVTDGNPYLLTMTPNGKFLYAGNWVGHSVTAFMINANGTLSSAGNYNIGGQSEGIVIESTGNYLYATSATNNKISAYRINQSTGQLTANGSLNTGDLPINIVIDPNNKFIYVANYYDNNISMYQINPSNGTISFITNFSGGANPDYIIITPNAKYMYTLGNGNSIAAYSINSSTGYITGIGNFSAAGGKPIAIAITPDSKYLYAGTNTGAYLVVAYSIVQNTGALTQVGSYDSCCTSIPFLDNVNGFLYTANAGSQTNISAFVVNSTNGTLSEVAGSPFASGQSPTSIAIAHIYQ